MGRLTMGNSRKLLGAVVPALALMMGACSSDDGAIFKNPDGGPDASTPETGGSGGKGSGGGPSTGGRIIEDGGAAGMSGGRAGSGGGTGGKGSGGKAGSGGSGGKGGSAGSGGSGGAGGSAGAIDAGPPDDGSPCHACPSGACLPDGGCAECVLDKHCPAERPRCDVAINKCVVCLATPTDNCKDGEYCAANACIPGCKASGGGCASGVCNQDHECTSCIADTECLSGRVCSSGTCAPSCGHEGDCSEKQTCCRDRCADLSRDKNNCLACGVACQLQQFCGRSGCADAIIANACKSAATTFLMDGLDIDDAMDQQLRDGMLASCPDKPTVNMVLQSQATTINPVTGQPVVGGGDLQVIVGGPYGQRLIGYLENTGATRIYYTYDGQVAQFHLRGADGGAGTVVVDAPLSILSPQHDYFLVEMVSDPTTLTLMFAVYGFDIYGTIAGTWYFNNVMLPSLSAFDQGYYIYEWTNADSDPNPSSGDTYTKVISGF